MTIPLEIESREGSGIKSLPGVTEEVLAFIADTGLFADGYRLKPLTRGLSNHNLALFAREGAYVLRVNRDESSAFCQRAFEAENWRLAASAGLAPTLVAQSIDGRCYLSPLLEDGGWQQRYQEVPLSQITCDAAFFTSPGQTHAGSDREPDGLTHTTRLLLDLLLGLQALPVPANVKGFTTQWQDYETALDASQSHWARNPRWQEAYQALAAEFTEVEAAMARLDAMGLSCQYSHRDLTPHNLLCHQGKLFCIDFEYACASHPLWDLAAVLASHNLPGRERRDLMDAYLYAHPQLESSMSSRVVDAVALHWYFGAIWALLMAGQSGDDDYLCWFHRYLQLAKS
ncbi:phosphotransferase [Shewanella amazonensis]|uniref:Aminoglycoside phosphotransferase n=1 Tax=Shewanella amazonensis (strain ATCC BAA-1098 / SB2B) TaxID=326297 RepID=A1S5K5_SHEAM|nr:phosphotransferase [Shewanella amazonensis]ABL99661.1 aminoglycoside phosphotransferase [Shewanella amazonensis SB2B]